DNLVMCLEELGMEIITDKQAGFPPPPSKKPRARKSKVSDEESSRRIDDPVRMYLTQMGEIPLLTREQEIALAKKIEITRKRFRRQLLESDYAMKQAVDILTKVFNGDLPFDRTIKVSVTEGLEKDQILGRMKHSLGTLEVLRERNHEDFAVMMSSTATKEEKEAARQSLAVRRRKMVTLVEELSLRTQRLQPAMKKLEKIAIRMVELERQIQSLKRLKSAKDERANLQTELHDLMNLTLETPESLKARVELIEERFAGYEQAMRELSGGNLRLVVSI